MSTQSSKPFHCLFVASALFGISTTVSSADAESHDIHDHDHHRHMETHASATPDDAHSKHRQAMGQIGYTRSMEQYVMPDLQLLTMQDTSVSLQELLDTDHPVAVNFIFTSCTTICPIMSATFSQAQKKLGGEADHIRWISISIDPEYDTPQRLRDYAKRLNASPHWSFITGSNESIVRLQKSFDVYRGDKMNHIPVTLLRSGRDAAWVRLDGLTSSSELINEYQHLMAGH